MYLQEDKDMIDIFSLKQSDIGRWVKFKNYKCEELGRIKSHNSYNVFVVFNCDNNWENYADYTAESVHPSRLEFVEEKI